MAELIETSLAQRALQLAESGEYASLVAIEKALHAEGYRGAYVDLLFVPLRRRLRSTIKASHPLQTTR